MYTNRNYPLKDMLRWTRKDIYRFVIISSIPVVLYSILDFKWLHLPWLPIALVGTAVAFIVGFKNNASYGRLWEARKIWGGIVNSSRTFALMVNDMINNDHAKVKVEESELRKIRKTLIMRHVAWMTAHRYQLRQDKPWETFLKDDTNKEYRNYYQVSEWEVPFEEAVKPYLSPEELNQITPKKNKAAQILKLQSAHLRELKERGLIWEFAFLDIEKLLQELFTLQGKNERIKNFPYPRQFATLNYYFVWIFILLLPFGIMNEFESIGQDLAMLSSKFEEGIMQLCYNAIGKNFVWLSIPFSIVISWIFHTMERIGTVTENPFEGTANDVPITTMSRDIEIDIRQMIDDNPDDIPGGVSMQHAIQT